MSVKVKRSSVSTTKIVCQILKSLKKAYSLLSSPGVQRLYLDLILIGIKPYFLNLLEPKKD
jgi:hypothetical protein